MNIVWFILCAAAVILLYWFLFRRRNNKYAELSGGFDHYKGAAMTDKEWLRILVLEELDHARRRGQYLLVQKSRKERFICTAAYILVNFAAVFTNFYKTQVYPICAVITAIYMLLFYFTDPVREVCMAVKAMPDREISQIVAEMCVPKKPANRTAVGIAAFVLSIGLFLVGTSQERFVVGRGENGMGITSYTPAFYMNDEVVIPEEHEGQPIVFIGSEVFKDMAFIRQVQIPETVERIGSGAFSGCKKLEAAELPENLKTLSGSSFKDCKRLTEITIPTGVTEIRGNTFEGCKRLKTVVLHDGIVDIHAFAFKNCGSLTDITLPGQITEIHESTFEGCSSLRKIVIPEGVTRIAAHAFRDCTALRNVSLPDSVTEIGSSAFRNCTDLQSIRIPANTKVNERAFKESPTKITTK